MPDPHAAEIPLTDGYRDRVVYDPASLAADAPQEGLHNLRIRELFERHIRATSYRDRSTVMVVPAVSNPACREPDGQSVLPIAPRVVQAWLSLQTPSNAAFTRIMIENAEVADAYNQAIQIILNDEGLSRWAYVLTCETDNIPPPGGLLQLIEDFETACACGHNLSRHNQTVSPTTCICDCAGYRHAEYDAISGLYWCKGPGGAPHCWGKPSDIPRSYRPWVPPPDSVMPVSGLSMGFTLFKIEMFKNMRPPWFRTVQEWIPGIGERLMTQDMYFANEAAKYGYRFAISSNVRVGHIDNDGVIW